MAAAAASSMSRAEQRSLSDSYSSTIALANDDYKRRQRRPFQTRRSKLHSLVVGSGGLVQDNALGCIPCSSSSVSDSVAGR
mmetsp:Transcript_27294/g.45919  ORF Transcript_27294/g.45919 Transcript_27294/m.45919 type:complete len:81 (+) Transcript_27294:648-890(+)